MRIGLVVPGFSANEADWCIPALRDLVQQLAAQADVQVFAVRYPYSSGRYQLFGAEVVALGGGTRRGPASAALWSRTLARLAAEHRARRFDVLHAFWTNETGAIAAVAGRLLGVPTMVSVAGGELVALRDLGYGDQLARTARLKTLLALRLARSVGVGSRLMLEQVGPWLGGRPTGTARLLPLGVDLERFRPAEATPSDRRPRLVHVASLVPVKDQETLLQAVRILDRGGISFTFEIAGSGPLGPRLQSLTTELGLSDRVCWRGAIAHDRLPDLYRRGDLFVLSSRHEAQYLAVLEAAATSLPFVSTNVGVAPELAPGAGMIVEVGAVEALAEAIATLLQEPGRRRELGQAARNRIREEFELKEATRRFRAAYEELQ